MFWNTYIEYSTLLKYSSFPLPNRRANFVEFFPLNQIKLVIYDSETNLYWIFSTKTKYIPVYIYCVKYVFILTETRHVFIRITSHKSYWMFNSNKENEGIITTLNENFIEFFCFEILYVEICICQKKHCLQDLLNFFFT